MSTFTNTAREVEMPNGDVVVIHNAPTGGENTTSNIKKFKYDDNGHVTESTAADAEDLNLSGYSTPTTGSTDIGTSDDVQTAIGKLDHQSHIDQTNIWYTLNKVGKNLLNSYDTDVDYYDTNRGIVFTNNKDGSWHVAGTLVSGQTNAYVKLYEFTSGLPWDLQVGDVLTLATNSAKVSVTAIPITSGGYGTWVSGNATTQGTLTITSEFTGLLIRFLVETAGTVTNEDVIGMICHKEAWDQDSTIEKYGRPNYDLTVREAEDRAALAEVVDEGAKNRFNINNITNVSPSLTITGSTITMTTDDSLSNLWLWCRIFNNSAVVVADLFDTTVTTNNIYTVRFTKTSNMSYIRIGHNGANTDGKFNYSINDLPDGEYILRVNVFNCAIANGHLSWGEIMICTLADWKISQNFSDYVLPNTDLTRMVNDLQKKAVKVYTYHVNPNESDPEDAVTYLDDATGLTPAKMGASSFSYGSWTNAWFLPRPCMLKSDGTVAYYLDPNDYSKKTDGTASDIADANFDGNVMLEFPKIWVKRVAGSASGERTVSIAPVNVDGTYKCWSNINAEDKEVDHFYLPAYNGTIHDSKMRSLSGVTLNSTYAPNYTRAQEVTAATANNPSRKNMWYTETWADMCLVYDLLYLMGKSLDVQRTFGQGLATDSETAMRAYVTGSLNDKGLFYGDISGTSTAVKVLGMENLWGCRWHGVAGLINDNGTLKVKMTYGVADGSTAVGYNTTGSGYLNYGSTYGTAGFVKKMQADNTMGYKIIETAGTDATYYCDYYYVNNSQSNYALLGGSSGNGANCGFSVALGNGAADAGWNVGGSLSCRP